MDQFVALVNRIVAVLNKINTSIQKLGDYVSTNTYALGTASVVEVVAVSAIEASTKIATKLKGVVISTTTTIAGVLKIATKLVSSVVGISDVADTYLTGIWTNRGSTGGFVTVDGTLRNTTGLLCVGSIAGLSGKLADLDIATKLRGSIIGAQGQCGGMLTGIV